jgi:hypothetical protein
MVPPKGYSRPVKVGERIPIGSKCWDGLAWIVRSRENGGGLIMSEGWHPTWARDYRPRKAAAPKTVFKVGDRVVPISKSLMSSFSESQQVVRAKEQGFLYVVRDNVEYYTCNSLSNVTWGDHFLASDLKPYVKSTQPQKIEVQLNENYSATVSKDKVTVGNMVLSAETIQKLIAAHEKLTKN